ncbi:hypothetical protein [Streptomyces cylindrosporus]|uniref:Uncharacterized protein n=1 Tax=Streptomyces cylindrosporus TaxID=2927583 RepID=A0ABS9Y226_9ACTN|nr:hypothetical protein [Streptomyces cylindrosporus]MCI3271064.1 hypothetical protein [Streptomyces cylindrosporus]
MTNRELRELAGLEITAAVRRRVNEDAERIATKKRGAVNTHQLTPAGRSWCESALVAGRPDGAKFPAGVLYAVLDNVGQYLARSGTKFGEFFKPDVENWIRAVYTELTVRREPGSWVRLSALRPWLVDLPRGVVDAELDRMIEQPDVQLMAGLNQRTLNDDDHKAAVEIGGEPRHLLRIGPA